MADLLAQQEGFILANDYGLDPRPEIMCLRHTLDEDDRWMNIANRELSTSIIIKYDSDDLEEP